MTLTRFLVAFLVVVVTSVVLWFNVLTNHRSTPVLLLGKQVTMTTTDNTTAAVTSSTTSITVPIKQQQQQQQKQQQKKQNDPAEQQAFYSADPSELKTLVVVLGSLRGGEPTWQTLYKNVLDANPHTDLAVITENPILPAAYHNASLFARAKYVWWVPKYKDWATAMDLVHNSSAWRAPLWELYHKGGKNIMLGGMHHGMEGSGAIIFMFRWFLSNKLQELNLIAKYDRFVVTRSDHYYLCPHDFRQLHPLYMWVPRGQDYRGICDRHLVANRDHILKALDILPPLLLHPDKYYKQLTKPNYNSERFLLHRWAEEGLTKWLRRFPRTMFTCATEFDTSRWSKGKFPVKEGVFMKYPAEYEEAHEGCAVH